MAHRGIDISSYQDGSPIDWAAVKNSGIDFVFIKWAEWHPTRGQYVNPYAGRDYANAKAAGLQVGVYFFGWPGTVAADAARWFASIAPNDCPLVLDLEQTNGFGWADVTAWGKTFMDVLQASVGTRFTAVYVNDTFLHSMQGCPWGYSLWLADPSNVDPGATRAFTQTGITPVPGISGGVDQDSEVDDAFYARFFAQPVVAPAATQPSPTTRPWYVRYGPWHWRRP